MESLPQLPPVASVNRHAGIILHIPPDFLKYRPCRLLCKAPLLLGITLLPPLALALPFQEPKAAFPSRGEMQTELANRERAHNMMMASFFPLT